MVSERAPWPPSRMARKRFSHFRDSPRVADPDQGLDEALGCEGRHDGQFCAERQRGLRQDDVGARGQRAIEDADIMRGEQFLGAPADRCFGLLLWRLAELAPPKQMA